MLQGTYTAIVNDLVERLKSFLDKPDLTWSIVDGDVECIKITSASEDVRKFLDDPQHRFMPEGSLDEFFFLPNRWHAIRIRAFSCPFARATAIVDTQDKVRLIVMFDSDNNPAPVELVS